MGKSKRKNKKDLPWHIAAAKTCVECSGDGYLEVDEDDYKACPSCGGKGWVR